MHAYFGQLKARWQAFQAKFTSGLIKENVHRGALF